MRVVNVCVVLCEVKKKASDIHNTTSIVGCDGSDGSRMSM
jgi:hypothetical protein